MNRGHGPSAHFSARVPFAHRPGFGPPHRGPRMMPHTQSPFGRLDADHNDKITKDEVMQVFAKVDTDGDGSITKEEMLKSLRAATVQHSGTGPQTSHDHRPGAPETRGSSGMRRLPVGRGPMGGGGPMGPGASAARGRGGPPSPSVLIEQFDKNKDSKLTKEELPEFLWSRLSKADANSDGEISKDEIEAHIKTVRPDGTSKPQERHPEDKPAPGAKSA